MPPTSQNTQSFEIGTRKSQLALLQTEIVVKALKEAWPEYQFNVRPRDTAAGDLDKVTPFKDMPVKNLWTHDLEQSLVEKKLDLLVHSLKDVPTQLPADCGLGAILDREDPRDAFVLKNCRAKCGLADLPAGSVVGTSSIRRAAQIALKYPHLRVQDVRGNVPTRLKKLDEDDSPFDALILAAAGLIRLNLGHRISEFLSSKNGGMLYAVGQGAIGIESRAKDVQMSQILEKINNNSTSFSCLAERSLLRTLEGGCSAPVGVETEWITGCEEGPRLVMRAIVVSVDGKESVEIEMEEQVMTGESADSFGVEVANALVAKGAGRILNAIKAKKRTEVVDLRE